MKRLRLCCLAALLLLSPAYCLAEPAPVGAYIQIEADGDAVYSRDGEPLYPAGTFQYVERNGDQYILVLHDGKFGTIDAEGELIIPVESRIPPGYAYGKAIVADFGKPSRYALIDTRGNNLTGYVWDWMYSQENGCVRVKKDGKYGFLNSEGELVIPPQYGVTGDFSEGVVFAQEEGEERLILDEGLNPVIMLDEDGEAVGETFSGRYVDVMRLSEGLAWYCPNDADLKLGYIDRSGKPVIPAQYDLAGDFHGGYAAVCADDEWSVIDRQGNTVYTFGKVDDVKTLDGGYAITRRKEGKDTTLWDLYRVSPDRTERLNEQNLGSIEPVISGDGAYRFLGRVRELPNSRVFTKFLLDENGEILNEALIESYYELPVHPFLYDGPMRISDDMLCVSIDGKYGYMNLNGEIVVPAIYDRCENFCNGHAVAFRGDVNAPATEGSFFLIDAEGRAEPLECGDEDLETALYNLAEKYGCHGGRWFDF